MLLTLLPTAAFAVGDTNAEAPDTDEIQTILPQSEGDAEQPTVTAPSYEVSTTAELSTALTQIAARADTEATIVLKADITLSNDVGSGYITSFGATDKHITVKSEGEMKKLSFPSYGVLTGSCTFDNVDVTGSRLFCNGYRTIFTENGQIHLSETLYGGGYKTTVNSTYVVIAASGYINPSSSSGLHDVIGGSYQGSVEGDTYLEITGDIQMQGGNHLNPGCMKGDGSSGYSSFPCRASEWRSRSARKQTFFIQALVQRIPGPVCFSFISFCFNHISCKSLIRLVVFGVLSSFRPRLF